MRSAQCAVRSVSSVSGVRLMAWTSCAEGSQRFCAFCASVILLILRIDYLDYFHIHLGSWETGGGGPIRSLEYELVIPIPETGEKKRQFGWFRAWR